MKRVAKFSIAALAVAMLPSAAFAEGEASGGFQISLTVPEICHLEASSVSIDEAMGQATASMFEMCNSDRGFTVLASYRTLESGEQVQVNYAGEVSQLNSSGLSEVAHRTGPFLGDVQVLVQSTGLTGGLAISFGMMPI